MRKIFVLRGGALGDFVVTLPALLGLRQQWPTAQIELAGNAVAGEIARSRGLIDRLYSQHDSRWSAFFASTALPAEFRRWLAEFDLVVNYWPDPDGDLARWFPLHSSQRFVTAPALPNRAPAAAHFAEALRAIGVSADSSFCRILPKQISWPATPLLRDRWPGASALSTREGTIAIHPGSGSVRKNWPANRWVELIGRIPSPILLVTGEAEAATWSRSQLEKVGLGERLRNGSLTLSAGALLENLITALHRCRLFLGHDSGVSHLAAGCDVPCLLLFGPTDPSLWAPPAPHVHVLQRGDELSAISVDDVASALRSNLATHASPAGSSDLGEANS